MFVIEIDDQRLLEDFANFLEFKLPGLVTHEEGRLTVVLYGNLAPKAQQRVLRRLLWAWRVEHEIPGRVPARFLFVAQTATRH